jgi:WD40 repeat protein
MKSTVLLALCGMISLSSAQAEDWIRVLSREKTMLFSADGSNPRETDFVPPLFGRQVSPNGKRTAFVSQLGIQVQDSGGANSERLSPDNLEATAPTWSPDGKQIAFLGKRGEFWQVHVMDHNGKNVRQISRHAEGTGLPKYGTDGRLAYMAYHKRVAKLQRADLMLFRGTETQTLIGDIYVSDYAWSPDGKTIARGQLGSLAFFDIAMGSTQELAFSSIDPRLSSHAASRIAWRSDGTSLACQIQFLGGRRQDGPKLLGDEELFVIPRSGKPVFFKPGIAIEQVDWINR